jgi:hypothetical protein
MHIQSCNSHLLVHSLHALHASYTSLSACVRESSHVYTVMQKQKVSLSFLRLSVPSRLSLLRSSLALLEKMFLNGHASLYVCVCAAVVVFEICDIVMSSPALRPVALAYTPYTPLTRLVLLFSKSVVFS